LDVFLNVAEGGVTRRVATWTIRCQVCVTRLIKTRTYRCALGAYWPVNVYRLTSRSVLVLANLREHRPR
jgi:hypothetical protein